MEYKIATNNFRHRNYRTQTRGWSPRYRSRLSRDGPATFKRVNLFIITSILGFLLIQKRVAIHGLTDQFLLDKPKFSEIAAEFLAFVKGAELIIHNAPFDVGFLNMELAKLKSQQGTIHSFCSVIDTLALARLKHPGQPNSLDALCRRYQVDNKNRQLHGALLDAELLAKVYLLMTGGQAQLFQEDDEVGIAIQLPQVAERQVAKDRKLLPIIKATAAELIAHHEFIEKNTCRIG